MSIERAKKVLKTEAEAVNALVDRIDDRFIKALDIIFNCSGRVVVIGMGKSGLIGKKIAATLASTGTPALFLHPAEGGHGDIGMVTKGDVVIALTNSGETDEIIRILPVLKRLRIKLITLTGRINSTIAKESEVVLDVSVKEEACPMGLVPTASTTAALAMGDAIAVSLLDRRNFKKEDFALFHPGGNIGTRLLMTVDKLMHKGNAVPSVGVKTLMKDAIIEISSKRLGITTVVDDKAKLRGTITDGDLRRGIEKWGEKFFTLAAGAVMTRNPKTITKEALAVQCIPIMEKYSITVLVVSDKNKKAEGIIHLHDLLKAGIV